jgi:6-pyruvoyl-tetrahydropterin synthase
MFYWVDFNEVNNRWLIKDVQEDKFVSLLKGRLSIRDFLLSFEYESRFTYLADLDLNFETTNVSMIDSKSLTDEYLPKKHVYFEEDEVPSIYSSLLEKYSESYYLETLRERAIYLKIEPTDSVFGKTVSAAKASEFLKNVSTSILSFIEEDFIREFKNLIGDFDQLKRIVKAVQAELSPRLVYSEYGSFEVGISSYTPTLPEDQKAFKDWIKSVLENYKNDVVFLDYESDDQVNRIVNKFDDNARKKIYSPFLKIVNDKSLKLETRTYNKRSVTKYKQTNKKNLERILPQPLELKEKAETKKLISLVLEVKGDTEIKGIKKKELDTGLLFSQPVEEVSIPIDNLTTSAGELQLISPILINLKLIENQKYLGTIDEFDIKVLNNDKEVVLDSLKALLIEAIDTDFESYERPDVMLEKLQSHL